MTAFILEYSGHIIDEMLIIEEVAFVHELVLVPSAGPEAFVPENFVRVTDHSSHLCEGQLGMGKWTGEMGDFIWP